MPTTPWKQFRWGNLFFAAALFYLVHLAIFWFVPAAYAEPVGIYRFRAIEYALAFIVLWLVLPMTKKALPLLAKAIICFVGGILMFWFSFFAQFIAVFAANASESTFALLWLFLAPSVLIVLGLALKAPKSGSHGI